MGIPLFFLTHPDDFLDSKNRPDFCQLLLALWDHVPPCYFDLLFDSFAECAQSRGFRQRFVGEFRLERLCLCLGEPFCTPKIAVSIFVLLTAVLSDFALPLSLSAPRFSPILIAEGEQNPRFIEAFSQMLVIGESRCALRSGDFLDDFLGAVRSQAAVIERFFFHCELRPEMSATRRVLAHQIREFPPSLQSPRYVGYISKLHACMDALMVETGKLGKPEMMVEMGKLEKTELTVTVSTLSLFLLNGRKDEGAMIMRFVSCVFFE